MLDRRLAFSQRKALLNGAFLNSVAIRKIRAGSRKLIFADRDKSIQPDPQPVANPSQASIEAGEEIRRICEPHVFVESTAQVIERACDKATFELSVKHGLNDRAPPRIRMPSDGQTEGRITDDPGEVREWGFLNNPDIFLGFGSGSYLMHVDGRYVRDNEQWEAMGGASWRPNLFRDLDAVFPDKNYRDRMSFIDQPGLYDTGDLRADVKELAFRAEWWDWDPNVRLRFLSGIMNGKAQGLFKNAEPIDETKSDKLVTYMVAPGAQKDQLVEHMGGELSAYSDVPLSEFEAVIIDDAPPGLRAGLTCLRAAKKVAFIVPAGSVIGPYIKTNEDSLAGVPLVGSPNHPEVPGFYHPCDSGIPGLYWWEGKGVAHRRLVIVAGETPWGQDMGCTESVLHSMKFLGY